MHDIKRERPKVSIITVSVNGKKWLKGLFRTILSSNYPSDKWELIYVDNGSTDGSIELAKDMFKEDPKLRIIENKKNLGWSPANNQGINVAKGEIVLCISNDMEVDRDWIDEIVKLMITDKTIGIVQCNSISMWDRKTPDSGMNYLDKFGYGYSYAPSLANKEVFFAEGMAFAVRQEVIKKIGVLDEYFFMEFDDMDYSWRARLAGYKIFFVPTAKVYHARGGTVGNTYFQRINNAKWYTRNHIITLIKNYELSTTAKLLPVILMMEGAKILYLLVVKRNRQLSLAASKGLLEVLRDLPIIFEKRALVQSLRKVSDRIIMNSMHPFNPWALRLFLVLQAKGKRLAIDSKSNSVK